MKFIFTLLALSGTTLAHNVVTNFHINGVSTSDCVRQAVSTDPIIDLQSSIMACNNVKGLAPKKCTIKPGDAIAFEWRADPNIAPADYPLKDGTIPVGVTDDSHKGPCAMYMKKVTDASNADGVGDGWFKVLEDGLDANGVFCSDRLRLANAPQPGVVPANIEPGDYLIRAEILTLNNAGPASMGGAEQPQFYVSCIQVTVEGSSGTNPNTVSIPGYVTMGPPPSPGLIFDIWNSPDGKFSNYTVPGPAPMSTGSGSPVSSSKPTTTPAAQPTSNIPTSSSKTPVPTTSLVTPSTSTSTSAPAQPTSQNTRTPVSTSDSVTPIYTPSETPLSALSSETPFSAPVGPTSVNPPNNPTRTPLYTVTTATTLITITSTLSPGETGTSDGTPPDYPTRTPLYTVTTATTLITITSTLSPGETGTSDGTPTASSEPTNTRTHGHGGHYDGRSRRRTYRVAL